MALKKKKDLLERGLTLIELLISLTTIAILVSVIFFSAFEQVAKGRDAQRKAELAKLQKTLEDYYNDSNCYPDDLTFGASSGHELEGYLTTIYADPLNNSSFNYLYTYDTTDSCHQWYKIYSRLEKEADVIIEDVGCGSGCGPDDDYNYWVSSPNISSAERRENEYWIAPEDGSPTSTPTPMDTPTDTPTSTPTPITSTSTPTPILTEEQSCLAEGGAWRSLGSSCGDSCYLVSNPETMCAAVMTLDCDCGPDACWNETTQQCDDNSVYLTPTPYNCFVMEGCSKACASSPTLCGQCCSGTTKECMLLEGSPFCCYTAACPL